MSDVAIRVQDLTKRYRIPLDRSSTLKHRVVHWRSSRRFQEFLALDGVSLEVQSGEFVGIIGHNGSGKSTLLKILSRILPPTSGSVTIEGQVSPFLELGVGFNPELTARENIFVNASVLGLTRREIHDSVGTILDFAELTSRADQKLKNFSSGMQAKLAFSVAIHANAGILLMDEVLAVGDTNFQEKCFDVFAEYRRAGRTVVLVTHDLGSVENYCDRTILLDHGRLVADGPPAEVTAQYRRIMAKRSDDSSKQDLPANRWGSGEVHISDVRLLDAAGERHRNFTTRLPMRIAVDVQVETPVDDGLVCRLTVTRADSGLLVTEANSHLDAFDVACPAVGSHATFEYTMERLPLLTGSYRLSVALFSRHLQHPIDYMEEAFQFKVQDDVARPGLVDTSGAWTFSAREPGGSGQPTGAGAAAADA